MCKTTSQLLCNNISQIIWEVQWFFFQHWYFKCQPEINSDTENTNDVDKFNILKKWPVRGTLTVKGDIHQESNQIHEVIELH